MALLNEANLARFIDMYIARKGGGVSKSIIKYNVLSIFEIILFMFFQSYVLNSVGFFPYKSRIKSNMWVLEAHHMPRSSLNINLHRDKNRDE